MFQDTIDDLVREGKTMGKEKEDLLRKNVELKGFIPLYEKIEKAKNNLKIKYLSDMKEQLGKDEFSNFIHHYAYI